MSFSAKHVEHCLLWNMFVDCLQYSKHEQGIKPKNTLADTLFFFFEKHWFMLQNLRTVCVDYFNVLQR